VRHYNDEAKSVAKERLYECHLEINENFQKAGQVLKLLTDDSIKLDTPFQTVQSNIFEIIPRQKLIVVAERMAKIVSFDETAFQWEHIDKLAHQFKLHLRQIILTVEFTTTLAQDTLIEAIDFLRLENRIGEVNRRITDGENEHFQIKKRRNKVSWNLLYPQGIDLINAPLFDSLKQVDIASILHFVDRHCHFIKAFEHVLGRYHRQAVDEDAIVACLIAWGNNMGMGRMGQISDISYQLLTTTSENFVRLETLKDANDLIINAIAELSIFHHYDIDNLLHSSSDGQKFEGRISTINSRHSPKYFGLNKGVVSYTLVANHIPVNARIIGANEHESHFVFDILFNNTTDIQPNIHSTDTHGTNEINFAVLHLFGYQFAPRYKDIYDKFIFA
jgi:hypothetical protein